MSDLIYTSRLRLERVKGPIRHAHLEGFDEPIRFGVHGAIKKHHGVESDEEFPDTLDYITAAVGSCLLGTLAGALAVRQIPTDTNTLSARVEGDVHAVDRVLRLTEIRVHYTLTIPAGTRAAADRALATHEQKCPAAASIRGAIPVVITSDVTELPA